MVRMSRRQYRKLEAAEGTRKRKKKTKPFNHLGTFASQWEADYALHLEALKASGEIIEWKYEPASFRIAEGARYTPDFLVVLPDKSWECHEVKGHWREAAKVRSKVFADPVVGFGKVVDFYVVKKTTSGDFTKEPI